VNNQFRKTRTTAFAVSHQESLAYIEGNVFEDIQGNAIFASEKATVTAVRNRITRASFPGFAILHGATATISFNEVSHLDKAGICVRQAQSALLEGNTISHCGECGVSISNAMQVTLTRNTILECGVAGVEVYNESIAVVNENKFTNTGKYALMAFTGGKVLASRNVVSAVSISFVNLTAFGGGTFEDNVEITECPVALTGLTSAHYLLKHNGEFEDVTNDLSDATETVRFVATPEDPSAGKCLRCAVRDRKMHCAPCGHKVFCTECGAQKGDGTCPLCRFPVDSVTEGFRVGDDGMCHLCLTEKANTIVLPCGHIEFCFGCLAKWFTAKNTCPSCNGPKSTFKRVLPDY
jgi:parallel beta-helix repeat protein